jgi:hypothetical protein
MESAEWAEQVLSLAAERFERRLTQEIASLRVDIAQTNTSLQNGLRKEMHDGLASLQKDLDDGLARVRQDVASVRVEILKWSFPFWIGQLAAVAGLLAFMLRVR